MTIFLPLLHLNIYQRLADQALQRHLLLSDLAGFTDRQPRLVIRDRKRLSIVLQRLRRLLEVSGALRRVQGLVREDLRHLLAIPLQTS